MITKARNLKKGDNVFIMGGSNVTYQITEVHDNYVITTFHPTFKISKKSVILQGSEEDMNKICLIPD